MVWTLAPVPASGPASGALGVSGMLATNAVARGIEPAELSRDPKAERPAHQRLRLKQALAHKHAAFALTARGQIGASGATVRLAVGERGGVGSALWP